MNEDLFPEVPRPNYVIWDDKNVEENPINNIFISIIVILLIFVTYQYFSKKNNVIQKYYTLEDEIDEFFIKRKKKTIVILGDTNKKDNFNKRFTDKIFLMNSVNRILSFLSKNKGTDFDIILHCEGANVSDCDLICSYLYQYSKEANINVYIPYYAFSSGTCIALCCNKIYLGPFAVLGPTDPQVDFSYSEDGEETFSIGIYQDFLKECSSKSKKYDIELEAINILMGMDANIMMKDNDELMKKLLEKHIKDNNDVQIALSYFNKGKVPHHKPLSQDVLDKLKIQYVVFNDKDIFDIIDKIIILEEKLPNENY